MGESQRLLGEAALEKDAFIQRGQLETVNMYSFRLSGGQNSKIKVSAGLSSLQRCRGKIRSLSPTASGGTWHPCLMAASLSYVMMANLMCHLGFPGGSLSKESASNAGDLDSVPGLGRSPGEGNGYPLQYSCLEKPTDRGTLWATVHSVAKSRTQLSK